ncbi:MAG: PAS domain S-box protein [Mojavia pulchra JT2-VF2]|jgi:PAS domain S-box-containing protein|uniref:histidine kinase n=1 Tax=Mojavia pulchra JT2-VF2 TaxID=287848 RepID=A0A951PZU1_9NOST|nr:PAS domain S-box protein [Mojavia pulchra JT2-VF2]
MQTVPQLLWLRCLRSITDFSPLTVEPETPVLDVIAIMAQQGKSALVKSASQVMGWFTEKALVKLVASGIDLRTTKVSEVMQTSVTTLKLSESLDMLSVLSQLRQSQLGLLQLVDEQSQLVGVITPESICQVLEQQTKETRNKSEIAEERVQSLESLVVNANDAILISERAIALQKINQQLLSEIAERKIVEEQLRQSQQMLQLIIDTIPQSVFWKNQNSIYLGCNRKFARMAGFENPEDIVGKTDYDFPWKQEESDLYRQYDARVIQTNTPQYRILETQLQANGEHIWIETHKVPLHDAGGNVVGILGTYEDITERKQAQEALEKSEERFRFLAESIPQQVWIAQADGEIEYVNQRTLDYLGCNQQEYSQREWQQWTHPEDWPRYIVSWQKSLATGEAFEVEFRWLRNIDKTYRWHLARALPLRDCAERSALKGNRQGKIVNWFGTITDIDARVSVEIALRESEERFRNLVEACSDLVWEVNENALYTYVSPQVRDILGYEPEAVLGKSFVEFMPLQRQEMVANNFAEIFVTPQPFQCLENIQIHQDGHLVVLETSGVPVFDSKGTFHGYRGISRDVTPRKQAEVSLQETQQQLQAILDNCSAAVYVVDFQNRLVLINSKFEKLFDTTQAEISGKSIYDIWSYEIADQFAVTNRKVIAGGIPIEVEEVVPHEDRLHTYLSIKFPLKDANGIPYASCGISTDITERKLVEESLLRFHKAIESTSDAIGMGSITGEAIYINPAFIKLYDYTLEQLQAVGGGAAIFKYPEDYTKVQNTIKSNQSWRGEVTMQTRSGNIVYVDLCADAIKDATGKTVGTICTHTDITKRKLAEEGLRLRDRAIAASSNGIIIADASIPTRPIIYVNSAFERMTGYCAAEVIGQSFCLFQSAEISEPGLQELNAAMQAGKDCTVILRKLHKDGSLLWNELNISPVYDVTGVLTHYIGIQTDITQRKQAETALLVSQQRLQYLLSSTPAVIYTCKISGDYGATFISENVSAMMGYEAREFIEDSGFWANHIHPEDISAVFAELSKAQAQGYYTLEYRFLHQDGNYRWIYDKAKAVQDEASNLVEFVGYWADITDHKQLEQELILTLEKEKELNELKSRFISMTSHEFRTPLSTILSSSELLEHYRHKWNEEKQLTHLRRIQTAVKRMSEMLNDVLFIGKAEAGILEYRPTSLNLVEYCRHLVEEVELDISNQRLISFSSQSQFIPCCMDKKLLGHILSNLLTNALKYSPSDSTVNFTLTCQDGQAIFEIQDQGIGIPPEDVPRIFESFHRASNVDHILGTGLGLAIVKKCVDIHQGKIFVTSTLGVGTKFTVTLPLNN